MAKGVVVTLKYPLFVLSKDDLSIDLIHSLKDFSLEKWMLEEDLFISWDSDGYPLKLSWEDGVGVKVDQASDTPELDKMRKAIFNYVDSYSKYFRPDKVFVYDKETTDYVELIKAMHEHIRNAPLKQKIINFFRRF